MPILSIGFSSPRPRTRSRPRRSAQFQTVRRPVMQRPRVFTAPAVPPAKHRVAGRGLRPGASRRAAAPVRGGIAVPFGHEVAARPNRSALSVASTGVPPAKRPLTWLPLAQAGPHAITAADPLPDDLRQALEDIATPAGLCTKLSQLWCESDSSLHA
jgi:hypothetical protein